MWNVGGTKSVECGRMTMTTDSDRAQSMQAPITGGQEGGARG